jgi:hypothetical protein
MQKEAQTMASGGHDKSKIIEYEVEKSKQPWKRKLSSPFQRATSVTEVGLTWHFGVSDLEWIKWDSK